MATKTAVFGSGFIGFTSEFNPDRIPVDNAVVQLHTKLKKDTMALGQWRYHRKVLDSVIRLMTPLDKWVMLQSHNSMLNRQAVLFVRDLVKVMTGGEREMNLFTRAQMFQPGFNLRKLQPVSDEQREKIFGDADLLVKLHSMSDADLIQTWVNKEGILKVCETLYVLFGRIDEPKRVSPLIE